MKTVNARVIVISVAVLVLGACVSTSSTPQNQISMNQASQDNVALGVAYLQQGRRDLAMQKLQLALQQNPDNANAYSALGLLYSNIGDNKRADENYREALDKAPTDPQIQNNYAVFLCRQGKPKQSEKYFVEAAQNPMYPTPEAAYANAGVCANLIPDEAAAEQFFNKSLAINPNYPQSLYEMARLSYQHKRYQDALTYIRRFESASPTPRPEVLLLGVRTENALGDRRGAEGYAKKLRILFPNSPQTQQLDQSDNNAGNPGN
ncbi:MAG: type IV pilus biogenesis/stability protein PilW [Gammaproteobacteria bacterium]|nr:type IV pilus biogenesis/stability protein PilW [Gammaproteobacteria bacterium]